MVDILLATYNSELYIKELLDSIKSQTYKDWNLIIRDDDSTDSTMDIILTWKDENNVSVIIIQDDFICKSAAKNFFALLQAASSEYVMFCDHDDVWLPEKIEDSLVFMNNLERLNPEIPRLVFTDYTIVDQNLNLLKNPKKNINKKDLSLPRELVDNCVIGCTVIMNRQLYSRIGNVVDLPIPMHDWWAAILACTIGEISYMDKPTIFYRQHRNNQVGADKGKIQYIINRLRQQDIKERLERNYNQAELFINIYRHTIPAEKMEILESFINIRNYPKWKKIKVSFEKGFIKKGVLKLIGQLISI